MCRYTPEQTIKTPRDAGRFIYSNRLLSRSVGSLEAHAAYAAAHHAQALSGQLDNGRLFDHFFLYVDDNFHGSLRAKVISRPELTQKLALFGSNQGQSDV